MKILVDTSVWADFFNGYPSAQEKSLSRLIAGDDEIFTCGVVVAEVFQGLRRDKGRAEIVRLFRELVFVEPSGMDTYLRAADVYRTLRRRGVTVRSTIDCLIAVVAEENECDVLARDRDLQTILGSGLLKARSWRIASA
ncbi:MAG TPA: PIN domain-containing protein [Thermoanaerobaculia bacterium]|nr:PIN domain-containing protein [Thermoanaerobaculia bacterium]